MTFLPIVERELRVAARRPGTYLTRLGVGLGAMVLGGIAGLVALFNPPVRFGTLYFQTLSGVAMAYCLGAGRFLTADCLSGEKREETMGLLFLTDLKGYDVVLGKMAATSLNGLYGLLAVLPVLAITLLTGGITNGEFWRVALVLLNTFLFSLAVGIFASALTREFRAAIALNFYLLLALAGFLPAMAGLRFFFHPSAPPPEGAFLPCPVYTLLLAFETTYKKEPAQFWTSAALILWISLALVTLACLIAPRSWQHKPQGRSKKVSRQETGVRARVRAFRNELLDQNAYSWLAARPWWKGRAPWVVLGVAGLWAMSLRFSVGRMDEEICLMVAATLTVTFKLWITVEAGQSLAEDMKSGAFELLLATPLSPRDIVRGQMLALRRQFLKPLLAVAGLELFFMVNLMLRWPGGRSYYFCLFMAGILMLAADAVTLSVVAMAASLTEKNLTRASLKTAREVLVLPWGVWAGVTAIRQAWVFIFPEAGRQVSWQFNIGCWFAVGMVLDFWYGWSAWRRLTENFRELALRQFAPVAAPAGLRARCAKTGRAIRDNIWRHPRNRKWAVGLATLMIIGVSLEVWEANRSHDPPPEVVLTGPGDAANFQAVAAAQGVYLILPDGSLWRWGQTDRTRRALLPERVGTDRDWSMVSANGDQRLGVRRDGTLWEWQSDDAVTQVGADKDWVEAVGGNFARKVARKKDGTLWEWGDVELQNPLPTAPTVWNSAPPVTNHDWKAVVSQIYRPPIGPSFGPPSVYHLAVDSDGTLWCWGTLDLSSGSSPAAPQNWVKTYTDPIQVCRETNWVGFAFSDRPQNNHGETWDLFAAAPNPAESIASIGNLYHADYPVQVGTNRDWREFESWGNETRAVRSDGTLWGWGGYYMTGRGGLAIQTRFSQPTQLCAETNWIGFDHAFGFGQPRNNAGERWALMGNSGVLPGPNVSIKAVGRLWFYVSASQQPAPPANPFRMGSLYEIHTNRTLWVSQIEFSSGAPPGVIREAQRADPRTDWLAVANAGRAAFGLTADGTLWTWGSNLGEPPRVQTRNQIQVAKMAIQAALGMGTAPRFSLGSAGATYPIQEKPRALMRLLPENGK